MSRGIVLLVIALVNANPVGGAMLLGNLYTAVWEGHAISEDPQATCYVFKSFFLSQMLLHICPDVQHYNFGSGLC